MQTLGNTLTHLQDHCKGTSVTKRDLQEILSHIVGFKRSEFTFHLDQSISKKDIDRAYLLASRKKIGEPIERILGILDFYGAKIQLTPDVLIPRPETEILVDRAIQKCKDRKVHRILDICTGSGCIGVAAKKEFVDAEVILSDISMKALAVAKNNAKLNNVNLSFIHSDLLDDFPSDLKADLVFCNPPYISNKEYEILDGSVKQFDPKLALVAEDDGLRLYKRLARELPFYLSRNALVCLEIGYTQKCAIQEIFSNGPWKEIICEKDFAGHDRFIFLECQ